MIQVSLDWAGVRVGRSRRPNKSLLFTRGSYGIVQLDTEICEHRRNPLRGDSQKTLNESTPTPPGLHTEYETHCSRTTRTGGTGSDDRLVIETRRPRLLRSNDHPERTGLGLIPLVERRTRVVRLVSCVSPSTAVSVCCSVLCCVECF